MITCPYCGSSTPEDSRFCNACGRPINNASDLQLQSPQATGDFGPPTSQPPADQYASQYPGTFGPPTQEQQPQSIQSEQPASAPWPANAPASAATASSRRSPNYLILAVVAVVVVLGIIAWGGYTITRPATNATLDTFCSSLTTRNYQLAYNQLTSAYQQTFSSETQFAQDMSQPTTVNNCTYGIISQSNGMIAAVLSLRYSKALGQNSSGGNTIGAVAVLIQDAGGTWKIDSLR